MQGLGPMPLVNAAHLYCQVQGWEQHVGGAEGVGIAILNLGVLC